MSRLIEKETVESIENSQRDAERMKRRNRKAKNYVVDNPNRGSGLASEPRENHEENCAKG